MRDIVIIGAGPAGLTVAYQLLKENNDVRVRIVEQGTQVGGISKTVLYNGNRIDLGGHRFFSKDAAVNAIWLELLKLQGTTIDKELEEPQGCTYAGEADPNTEENVMLLRRRISRIYYDGKFFDYPISLDMDTLKKLGFWTSLKCGGGYLLSCLFKCKGDSLEDFYINRFGKPLYRLFFKDYTTKLWGVSPRELDASWGAQRVKKLSLSKMVFDFIAKSVNKQYKTKDTSLIEQFYYPKRGPGQLWEEMAKAIVEAGGEILYGTTCARLLTDGAKITAVAVTDATGIERQISCDYVVSSMPVKELIRSLEADVPQEVKLIAEGLPYRDFITVGVLVDKLELSNTTAIKTKNDIPPDCWIYVQDSSVKVGRIQVFNNWSPFLVADPANTVWIGLEYFCSEQDELWRFSEQQMAAYAVKELQSMGVLREERVRDTVVLKQKKAYPAYFGTYDRFDLVKRYVQQFNNLICVGRNGQHRYNNMDHSMLTGIAAVNYINGLADAEAVWRVNTEQDYHEEGSERP